MCQKREKEMRLVSMATIGILITPLLYAGSQTHCSKQDEVIFSCFVGKKVVSVCGEHKKITYYFGAIGSPELVFNSANPSGGTLMYSGGGGAYLRLSNGVYRYVLYTGIGRGWEKEGLALEKNGRLVKNFECKSTAQSEIGAEFFDKYRITTDEGFDIP